MSNNTNVRMGVRIPNPSERAAQRVVRLTQEAERWANFALARSAMSLERIRRKASESFAFALEHNTQAFAVPTKLCGTRDLQEALRVLHNLRPLRGHRLDVSACGDRLAVSFADMLVGFVQDKHAPWLRPLLEHGAAVYLLGVTGHDAPHKYLGLNVAIGFVAQAIEKYSSQGDGAATAVPEPDEDVRLWRARDGSARTNAFHVVRHSPTGISWGYGGSGPADLARLILLRFVGPGHADRLYQQFKHDVISAIPYEGGTIRAAFVRLWLSHHMGEL